MKTAISISDPVFRAAERLAKQLGIPRSRLYSQAIERYVAEAQRSDVTRMLDEIYSEESAALDHFIDALQLSSIPRERW